MLTWASPPGSVPRIDLANSMSRLAIPPEFMICPARMKNGIARSVNESSPVAIRCATVVTLGPVGIESSIVRQRRDADAEGDRDAGQEEQGERERQHGDVDPFHAG